MEGINPLMVGLFGMLMYLAIIAGVVYFASRVLQALGSIQRSAEDIANSLRSSRESR